MTPVRIFVGTSPNQMDLEAEIALEHAIRTKTSGQVEITWMRLTRDPASPFYSNPETGGGYNTRLWSTPFTGLRWTVPSLCDFAGRAIYMDVDTLPRADMRELFEADLHDRTWMARDRNRSCVMLIDCSQVDTVLGFTPDDPLVEFPQGQNWNCLDGDGLPADDPAMKCVHFTTIDTQPHLTLAIERLGLVGHKHWFGNRQRKHWRLDLEAVWFDEYLSGVVAGLGDQDPHPFGYLPLRRIDNYAETHPLR